MSTMSIAATDGVGTGMHFPHFSTSWKFTGHNNMRDGTAKPTTKEDTWLSLYKTKRRIIGTFCSESVKSACLSPKMSVISVEPDPDDDTAPFVLKPVLYPQRSA